MKTSDERGMITCQVTSLGLLLFLALCVGGNASALECTAGYSQESQQVGRKGDAPANPPEVIYDSARQIFNSADTSRTMVVVIEKKHRGFDDAYSALRSIAEQH